MAANTLAPSITFGQSDDSQPSMNRLSELQARLVEHAMKEAGIPVAEAALTETLVNRWDYRPAWGRRQTDTQFGMAVSSTLSDRKDGKNAPLIENETDLATTQGMARYLEETLAPSKAIKNSIVPYVFGSGYQFDVKIKKDRRPNCLNAPQKIARVQDWVTKFLGDNNFWGGESGEPKGAEMLWRPHRDGECINLFATENQGKFVKWRIADPRQLTEPMGSWMEHVPPDYLPQYASNVKWGIHTADHDCEETYGYCIAYDIGQWVYYPENYVAYFRNNVDGNVARGLTDYYPIMEWLNLQPRLMRATGEGAREQASIAYIVEHALASAANVITLQSNNGSVQMEVPNGSGGSQTFWQGNRPPGTALHVGQNQKYQPGPMGADRAVGFIDVSQALLRLIGSRFMMSEGQISGNDSNNNFASSITAGSRFWAYARYLQGNLSYRYLSVIWKAIKIAFEFGQFPEFSTWEEFEFFIEIIPTAPKIESQNKAEDETVLSQRYEKGIITKAEYRSAIGFDPDLDDESEDTAPAPLGPEALPQLLELSDRVSQGALTQEVAAQMAIATLGMDEQRAQKMFAAIQPSPQAGGMPGQPGMAGPGAPGQPGQPPASGMPGQDQPQQGADPGGHAAATMNLSRMQYIRNSRAINDIVDEIRSKATPPLVAQAKLEMLGFAPDKAKAIVDDLQDGKLDQPQLLQMAEDLALDLGDSPELRAISADLACARDADAAKPVAELFDESEHPRGDDGKFIDKDDLETAKTDAGARADLFARTTNPGERAKLESIVGKPEASQQQTDALKKELIGNGGFSVDRQKAEAGVPAAGTKFVETTDDVRSRLVDRLDEQRTDAVPQNTKGPNDGIRKEQPGGGNDASSSAEKGGLQNGTGVAGQPGRVESHGKAPTADDPPLKGLPTPVAVAGRGKVAAEPFKPARQAAIDYMKNAGLDYHPPTEYVKVDQERAKSIAAEFDKMKHDPENPEVKAAYAALAKETMAQFKAVQDAGLKIDFIKPGETYPYATPRHATLDVIENNHMWVFPTAGGFGSDSGFDPKDNPLLADTGIEVNGHKMVVNDAFRVVHDYFGHVKENVGFRADGEENAWRSHASMFSPEARRAMTTETRGQNSWLNFGPHGETNRTAKTEDTVFADQKIGLLPEWVSTAGSGRSDDTEPFTKAQGEPKGQYPKERNQPEIDTVRSGKEHSFQKYVGEDGKINPERRKLWDAIRDRHAPPDLETPKDRAPVMIMTGGGPASGKSTMLKSGNLQLPEKHYLVDPDSNKLEIPEYVKLREAGDPLAGPFVQQESSEIGNEIQLQAIARKVDSVIDGTGDGGFEYLASRIERAREAGIKTVAYYATNDVDLALKLAKKRGEETGRNVPPDAIRGIHGAVSRVFPQLLAADTLDEIHLYDTNIKDKARLVVSKVRGEPAIIHDKKLYDDFLAKAKYKDERPKA